jgi:hypothetical protein
MLEGDQMKSALKLLLGLLALAPILAVCLLGSE